MKYTKIYITILAIFSSIFAADADLPITASVSIYCDHPATLVSPLLFGYNYSWVGISNILWDQQSGTVQIPGEINNVLAGLPLPLNRMSGTASQYIHWKLAIGHIEERKEQPLAKWMLKKPQKLTVGPIEWIKSILSIDSNARFSWTLNLALDTAEDHADLAEFFLGDGVSNPNGGINWAKKRIELGLARPVPVLLWELGNELDWMEFKDQFPIEVYVKKCKEAITAIRAVNPSAKFAAHATTSAKSYTNDSWKNWHQTILKKIGSSIDYMVYHAYYHGIATEVHERIMNSIHEDITNITGSDRIRFYISEHARWNNFKNDKTQWYQTHSLAGCLSTAQWVSRMLQRGDVDLMTYHCFAAGPWEIVYLDEEKGQLYKTGIADLFKLLSYEMTGFILKTEITGAGTDGLSEDLSLTAAAALEKNALNILVVNRDERMFRELSFKCNPPAGWTVIKETVLTADDILSHNTVDNNAIRVTTAERDVVLDRYMVPAKCVMLLHAVKK